MRLLGIDYGERKIGLATAFSILAEPYMVIRYKDSSKAIGKISKLIGDQKIEIIVVGISEGFEAKKTKKFVSLLQKKIDIPIIFQDETLSTLNATERSINANIQRKKRKRMEDAYSATTILQNYIDSVP